MKKHYYRFLRRQPISFQLVKIIGVAFENEWCKLTFDGILTVKRGYAWDGCTPKFSIGDLFVIGTPDGIKDYRTDEPITYFASLIHDVLMQFRDEMGITVHAANDEFYYRAKQDEFKLARAYRTVLGIYWTLIAPIGRAWQWLLVMLSRS